MRSSPSQRGRFCGPPLRHPWRRSPSRRRPLLRLAPLPRGALLHHGSAPPGARVAQAPEEATCGRSGHLATRRGTATPSSSPFCAAAAEGFGGGHAWAAPWWRRGRWRRRHFVGGPGPGAPAHGAGAPGRRARGGGALRRRRQPRRQRRRPTRRRRRQAGRCTRCWRRRWRRGAQTNGWPPRRLDVSRVWLLPLLPPLAHLHQVWRAQAQRRRRRRQGVVGLEEPVHVPGPRGRGRVAPHAGAARAIGGHGGGSRLGSHHACAWRQRGSQGGS